MVSSPAMNPIVGTPWTADCGGTYFSPLSKMPTCCGQIGGRPRRKRKTRRRGKQWKRKGRRTLARRRYRTRNRRAKRRRSRRRLRGGSAANTLLPQPLVNLGRGLLTNGVNLIHNYKGTNITPSPYPTSQHQQHPMEDVYFGKIANVQAISKASAATASKV